MYRPPKNPINTSIRAVRAVFCQVLRSGEQCFKIGHLGDALGLLWVPSSSMGRKELAVEDGSRDATRARERSPPKGVMTIAILGVI
jgi:hypothetical protein